jgi:hypothetical protein
VKQGTEYVYIKFSLELFKQLKGEWSQPVVLKLEENYAGDVEMVTRNVKNLSLRDLAGILNG